MARAHNNMAGLVTSLPEELLGIVCGKIPKGSIERLSFAATCCTFAAVDAMHRQRPQFGRRTIVSTALRLGRQSVLEWARSSMGLGATKDDRGKLCMLAAAQGHLELLQWCRANDCEWNQATCSHAASGGHLELLQWCRANGCEWDADTCRGAAVGGHLELLQWCLANGCAWDADTCSAAARGGHLELLQWCRANGCG